MKRTHSSRGSILLLVIGLLTMVAMLGATFLIVARVNTRQIKEASIKNLGDPVAAGAVASLAERLRVGLCIGDTGPYSAAYTRPAFVTATSYYAPVYDANSWKMFIDYSDPMFINPADTGIESFLAHTGTYTPGTLAGQVASPLVLKTWTLNAQYNPGDVVATPTPGTGYCFCMGGHVAASANNPGTGSFPWWSSSSAYGVGSLVLANNVIYQSLTSNTNRNPPTSNGDWLPLWGICPQVDVDGNGIPDAYLVPTNVVTSTGDRYFVAIKVSDTSGKLNLNTATSGYIGSANLWTNPISQVNVDLALVLGTSPGAFPSYIANNRVMSIVGLTNPSNASELPTFYSKCVQQLLNPASCTLDSYIGVPKPYAVSEETYLACYTPAAQIGLLYWNPAPNPSGVANYNGWYLGDTTVPGANKTQSQYQCNLRSQMTVWSSTRPLARRPDPDLVPRALVVNPGNGAANSGIAYDTSTNYYKNQAYQQALAMLNPLIPDVTTRKYAAASFTANLWYHLDAAAAQKANDLKSCWGFQPLNPVTGVAEPFVAFATPSNADQPPIYATELYFKTDGTGPPTSPTSGPKSYKAVELWNPSSTLINTNTALFFIKFGNGAPIALTGTALPGVPVFMAAANHFTLVICSGGIVYNTGLDAGGNPFQAQLPAGTMVNCSNLTPMPDFTNGPIQILKQVTVNGTTLYMPIDQIDPTAGGALSVNYAGGSPNSWDMSKDDSGVDNRYAVAAAVQITKGTSPDATHTLGASNTTTTIASPGIGLLDSTFTPARPAAAPYPVYLPNGQLTSTSGITAASEIFGVNVPSVNTVGDLCEVYCCGPITLNPTTTTGPFYPFSAMISTNGPAGSPNFVTGFPVTDPVRGRLNLKGYPAWNAATTYPAGSMVVNNNVVYMATAASLNQAPPGATWAISAGWPKTPTIVNPGLTPIPSYYPDVPSGCLLGEFLETLPTDPTRTDESRYYGKINVNTATQTVLLALPWPISISINGTTMDAATIRGAAVEFLQAYRDQRVALYTSGAASTPPNTTYTKNYTTRSLAGGSNIPGLRATSAFNGYLTPSEVAVPLADLATLFYTQAPGNLTADHSPPLATDFTQQYNYVTLRDQMYRAISNVITVRSDTFRANIYVELRDPSGTRTRQYWRYLTVIDRSNCRKASDRPAVVLFTEIR